MKITKYPQSCLLVETAGVRLLIDPGGFVVNAYEPSEFGAIDAVLYTHRHGDHFDPKLLAPMAEQGARFIANQDTASLITDFDVTVLDDRDTTDVDGVRVQAYELEHCPMVDGSPGPPNVGYVVADQLLHPGDGYNAPTTAEIVAVPIAGPSISFRDAHRMLTDAQARHAVPIHYDYFIAKPEMLASNVEATVHVLDHGESVDIAD